MYHKAHFVAAGKRPDLLETKKVVIDGKEINIKVYSCIDNRHPNEIRRLRYSRQVGKVSNIVAYSALKKRTKQELKRLVKFGAHINTSRRVQG